MNKATKKLTYICSLAYFVSYLTRVNFGAVIAAIVSAGDIDKTSAGAVTTLGFITYGVGQLISGWLADRINPKKLMFLGFITTGIMNLLIPFCPNGTAMCVVWAFNGFAQSFMWPPMVKIMNTALDIDSYNKSIVKVTWGSTIATIMIYLVSPLIIKLTSWRGVFYVASAFGLLMSALWYASVTSIEKKANIVYEMHERNRDKNSHKGFSISAGLLAVTMLAILLQGSLRDGVTTWVPTYITEVFHLGSEVSILSGVIMPIFGILSLQLSSVFYNKTGKKPFVCAGILFGIAVLCSVMLVVLRNSSFVATLVFCSIIVAVMHGINLILVCFLPAVYSTKDSTASLSGLMNFTTYVGSAASTYGFALISEKSGWNATVFSWLIIALIGATACVVCNFRSKSAKA